IIEDTVPKMTVDDFAVSACHNKLNVDIAAALKKVADVRHVGLEKVKLVRTAEKETVLLEA
ncbi:MAG: 30S ribosomal protein S3ae, partial [Nitrosopumilus sp.]|nr:30S ribosomal protein S3ae [Nitrosopumilus sp.]